ncbi:hypothetical protein AAX06_06145 [Moraxella bovoculi]|uniref:Glycoside hydrolase family 19 catalytic domain-containing protein n=1 Tax=Moraxella bovoculi TaxID=386891 RepID=A0AAC8PVX0_9GAMM|nr:glycoside hydrolase family 19 protein [Moraxella bovoculi]AKG07804.1 hypothetical protein AAX06_06145 [Moraxella bovoculi]AKG11516.1 hypothetical protein AAX07_05375 [Moraxella bovoculi]
MINTVQKLQQKLGLVSDGIWGKQSQATIKDKTIELDFNIIRNQFGRLNQSQVDGFNAILKAINEWGGDAKNPLYVAYMLATAWHETAHTMKPIEEYGKGKGRRYSSNIDINGTRYTGLKHLYYGRGYVQLTWLTNYKNMGKVLDVDLVNKPELALDHHIASKIMIYGMLHGSFTGKKLSNYLKKGTLEEFKQARRIINGMDKATNIAYQAQAFLQAIIIK